MGIVHSDLLDAGLKANSALNDKLSSDKLCNWTSSYSGIDVIVNWVTPPHWDASGTASFYDLLISLGEGHQAEFHVSDLDA